MNVSTALVGPLPTVAFAGGPGRDYTHRQRPFVVYTPPSDTCDPRYAACTDHHVACDCREAEWAETRQEWRYHHRELQAAFDDALVGHPTWQWSDDGNTCTGCMCTGCQIARAIHIHPKWSIS